MGWEPSLWIHQLQGLSQPTGAGIISSPWTGGTCTGTSQLCFGRCCVSSLPCRGSIRLEAVQDSRAGVGSNPNPNANPNPNPSPDPNPNPLAVPGAIRDFPVPPASQDLPALHSARSQIKTSCTPQGMCLFPSPSPSPHSTFLQDNLRENI